MKVNKYSVVKNGKTIYKSNWSGAKKLAFASIGNKHYTFNAKAKSSHQSSKSWKLIRKNGDTYLQCKKSKNNSENWKKYIKSKNHKILKVADNKNFLYNAYRPGYLNSYVQYVGLYSKKEDIDSDNPLYIDDFTKKLLVKWPSKNHKDGIIQVKYKGKIYYTRNNDKSIVPYNTFRQGNFISSQFKPTSKKVLLAKGDDPSIYIGDEWKYKQGEDYTINIYKFNGKKWVIEKFKYLV